MKRDIKRERDEETLMRKRQFRRYCCNFPFCSPCESSKVSGIDDKAKRIEKSKMLDNFTIFRDVHHFCTSQNDKAIGHYRYTSTTPIVLCPRERVSMNIKYVNATATNSTAYEEKLFIFMFHSECRQRIVSPFECELLYYLLYFAIVQFIHLLSFSLIHSMFSFSAMFT